VRPPDWLYKGVHNARERRMNSIQAAGGQGHSLRARGHQNNEIAGQAALGREGDQLVISARPAESSWEEQEAIGHVDRSDCTTYLARAEVCVREQVLQLARLRAPVLPRRVHLRAELRRRVPWPAWVVEDAARERDCIRFAAGDDRLGLLGFGIRPTAIVGSPTSCFTRAAYGTW